MDKLLSKLIEKFGKFFNVSEYMAKVEFASHTAWSVAFPAVGWTFWGMHGMQVGLMLWFLNTNYEEFIRDGHGSRMFKGAESKEEFKDFLTDYFSKLIPGLIYAACVIARVA